MQRAEMEQTQPPFRKKIRELKDDITALAAQREALEQEHLRHSPVMRRLSKYMGFGAAGKLEWVCFKLKFKQEELARLTLHPDEPMKRVAVPLHMAAAPKDTTASETTRQKMERMVTENPAALEPYIRRVYQTLLEDEQKGER